MLSLDTCFQTWAYQSKSGYIFLGKKKGKKWTDKAFAWPSQKKEIGEWAKQNQDTNLYWCPLIFKKPRRLKIHALPSKTLYADLDLVRPHGLDIKPTVAWKSSDTRYQALWFMDVPLDGGILEKVNKALTYDIGADRGGWDITQVLRVPGSNNYKYDPPQQGKLLWSTKATYGPGDFPELPPEEDTYADGGTILDLLSQYKKLPPKVRSLLQYPPDKIDVGKRSDTLWYLEKKLIKAKVPLEDVIELIRLSAWNKYRGRADEQHRLKSEITKVYEDYASGERGAEPEEPKLFDVKTYAQLMGGITTQPGWLVKDIWLKHSHGIVAGEPKSFKSTLTLDLAVSVASGHPLWSQFDVEDHGPVVIVQNENADWIIKDRFEKITASKGLVGNAELKGRVLEVEFPEELPVYFINNQGFNFSNDLHLEAIEEFVGDVKPVLVIFDPLYLMIEGNINNAEDLRPTLQWLLRLRNEYNTGAMVIHHWNKSGDSPRGGQRMLGSTTLHAWIESALYTHRDDPEGGKQALVSMEREFRHGAGILPKLDFSITMGDFGSPLYNPCLKEASVTDSVELLDLLSLYPRGLGIRAVATELKISRRQVSALIQKLKGKVHMSGDKIVLDEEAMGKEPKKEKK